MKKVVVHPDYAFCADFIDQLPDRFHREGKTIFKARNEVKIFKHQGLELVVKSFRIPHVINQFAYSALRASKAERAYRNALILLDKSILTPIPIAYIEIKKFGLLFHSYFIAQKSRFDCEIRKISDSPDLPEAYPVLSDLARFTAGLHQKGIFHKDYSPGNILFGQTNDRYEFELLDLNRMRFCKISLKKGIKVFERLCLHDDMLQVVVQKYTEARIQQN